MILKDKQLRNVNSPKAIAGEQQEKDFAFYLRRAYKDHDQVFVINDFSFSHNNENAQIDHLIVCKYGFILIESKSIAGFIKVNKHGEWTRTVHNKWQGMPSPIKQVEMQQSLLKDFLQENRTDILPKMIGIQQTFSGRKWHHICAVSSNAVLDRDGMPIEISDKIVKSEFIQDALNKLMNLKRGLVSAVLDDRAPFNKDELNSITSFLLKTASEKPATPTYTESSNQNEEATTVDVKSSKTLACKKCGETSKLQANYGRYGYYVTCNVCGTTTSMKSSCPSCASKNTKVSKQGKTYRIKRTDCLHEQVIFDAN